MKSYKIIKTNYENYEAIIFAQSYETPFLYLDEVSHELKEQGVCNCRVVFDMLLSVGNTTERYTEAIFDGEKFIESSFKSVKIDKKDKIRKIVVDYIKTNSSIVENSILTSLQVKMINKGIAI